MEARLQETLNGGPRPHPALRALDVLAGTWEVDGSLLDTGEPVTGDVTFAWMLGGFYLVQHLAIDHAGEPLTGVEYIGYDVREDAFRSCFFGSEGPSPFGGISLEYVWEVRDDGLSVRAGDNGRAVKFDAVFTDGADTLIGRWEWPGGGYEVTMRRAVAGEAR